MRSDQFSGLMLLALALYVAWANREYPVGSLAEPAGVALAGLPGRCKVGGDGECRRVTTSSSVFACLPLLNTQKCPFGRVLRPLGVASLDTPIVTLQNTRTKRT